MNSDYVAKLIHEERAAQLRAEAAADRLARDARRGVKRSAARPARTVRAVFHRQPGRHAV